MVLRCAGDFFNLVVEGADIPGVDSYASTSRLDRGENIFGLKVNIGDNRNGGAFTDFRQRIGVILGRASHADNVASRRSELCDLLQSGLYVGGQGGGHGLHRDGSSAAHRDFADIYTSGLVALGQLRFRRSNSRHSKIGTHPSIIPHPSRLFRFDRGGTVIFPRRGPVSAPVEGCG